MTSEGTKSRSQFAMIHKSPIRIPEPSAIDTWTDIDALRVNQSRTPQNMKT